MAVVVDSPGLDVGDGWQRQFRGSSRRSYRVRVVWGVSGQREAVQWVESDRTAARGVAVVILGKQDLGELLGAEA